MKWSGWIFLVTSWTMIVVLLVYSYKHVLKHDSGEDEKDVD